MALYDPSSKRIVVRIAYDGPAEAGKTSNLVAMCSLFTTQRRSGMWTPDTRAGRTMYFDWLQLDGGLVDGHPLRSHLVTVPGQVELRGRRRYLLSSADVVVFVCESTAVGVEDARSMLDEVIALMGQPGESSRRLVVQANKQDLPGALSVEEIRNRLRLPAAIQVVPAAAVDGEGVREALTHAIRAAAIVATDALADGGIDALAGTPETTSEIYDAIRAAEVLSRVTRAGTAVSAVAGGGVPDGGEPNDLALPSPFVPLRFIRPKLLGRSILQAMALDRMTAGASAAAVTTAGRIVVELPQWRVVSSAGHCFGDEPAACDALTATAQRWTKLGTYHHHRAVLSLQPREDGALRLWRLAPRFSSLADELATAVVADSPSALGELTSVLAQAAADCMAISLRHNLLVDFRAHNIARDSGQLLYIGDELHDLGSPLRLAYTLLHLAEDLEDAGVDDRAVHDELAAAVTTRVQAHPNLARTTRNALDYASPRTQTTRRFRERLLGQLRSRGGAQRREGRSG